MFFIHGERTQGIKETNWFAGGRYAADFDHSGTIDLGDLAFFAANYQGRSDDSLTHPAEVSQSSSAAAETGTTATKTSAITSSNANLDGTGALSEASDATMLRQTKLDEIVDTAIARWVSAGFTDNLVTQLRRVPFVIDNLGGKTLGLAEIDTIFIDDNAAGNGWYVDRTPMSDEEFTLVDGTQQSTAPDAAKRMDLLTVVEHELGHVLGLEDLNSMVDGLMNPVLQTGVRRSVGRAEIDALFADNDALDKVFAHG